VPHTRASSRPRSSNTVARTRRLSLHALHSPLRSESSLSCPRSPSSGRPNKRVGRAHVPPPGHPSVSRSATALHRGVSSAMKAFAFRSPESTKHVSPPVSRDETGPSHGPRSHEIASVPYPKAQPGRPPPDHAFWTRDPRTILEPAVARVLARLSLRKSLVCRSRSRRSGCPKRRGRPRSHESPAP
jgi:hypothetical protein